MTIEVHATKSVPFEILLATSNNGKIAELVDVFSALPVTLRLLKEFGNVVDVSEVGTTYEQNAALKARGYFFQTGVPALADDSGLEVDALDGKPGVFSARFGRAAFSNVERNDVLLKQLAQVNSPLRTARFVCCMVLFGTPPGNLNASPDVLAVSRGVCEGRIANKPSGNGGFGFDPIFVPNGYDASFATLQPAIKGRISHRALAGEQMRKLLEIKLVET